MEIIAVYRSRIVPNEELPKIIPKLDGRFVLKYPGHNLYSMISRQKLSSWRFFAMTNIVQCTRMCAMSVLSLLYWRVSNFESFEFEFIPWVPKGIWKGLHHYFVEINIFGIKNALNQRVSVTIFMTKLSRVRLQRNMVSQTPQL